jgi:hypothetical protein
MRLPEVRIGPAEGEPQRFVELLERLVLAERDGAHDRRSLGVGAKGRWAGKDRLEGECLHIPPIPPRIESDPEALELLRGQR